jgi:hypothetical protein
LTNITLHPLGHSWRVWQKNKRHNRAYWSQMN